jgi:hypothetical protein
VATSSNRNPNPDWKVKRGKCYELHQLLESELARLTQAMEEGTSYDAARLQPVLALEQALGLDGSEQSSRRTSKESLHSDGDPPPVPPDEASLGDQGGDPATGGQVQGQASR